MFDSIKAILGLCGYFALNAVHNHDDIHVKIEYPKSDLIFN